MKKSHKHSKITVCAYNSPYFEKLQKEEQKGYKVILQVSYLHDSKIIVEFVDKELYEKEELNLEDMIYKEFNKQMEKVGKIEKNKDS